MEGKADGGHKVKNLEEMIKFLVKQMVFLVYHLEESSTVQVKGVGIGARLEGGKKW